MQMIQEIPFVMEKEFEMTLAAHATFLGVTIRHSNLTYDFIPYLSVLIDDMYGDSDTKTYTFIIQKSDYILDKNNIKYIDKFQFSLDEIYYLFYCLRDQLKEIKK